MELKKVKELWSVRNKSNGTDGCDKPHYGHCTARHQEELHSLSHLAEFLLTCRMCVTLIFTASGDYSFIILQFTVRQNG